MSVKAREGWVFEYPILSWATYELTRPSGVGRVKAQEGRSKHPYPLLGHSRLTGPFASGGRVKAQEGAVRP